MYCKKLAIAGLFVMFTALVNAQSADQTINTNNVTNTTSTVNSNNVNTNNNVNTSTVDSTSISTNINQSESNSVNTNNNNNVSTSNSNSTSIMDSRNYNDSKTTIDQTLRSPPPSAIAPAMMSGGNNDLCTTGVSGAVQTQILGISGGGTVRDLNCERLKLSKTLYDMGMKVAAVSALCQDERVFTAMMNAGTPCPVDGKIGAEAKQIWDNNPARKPETQVEDKNDTKAITIGAFVASMLILLF